MGSADNCGSEYAKRLYQLGCLYFVLGQHENCTTWLEASLSSLSSSTHRPDNDALDTIKMLAINYDAMNDSYSAIGELERALALENNVTNKARLFNALSHLHLNVSGQSHSAVDYLKKSLEIQQADANSEGKDADFLCDTMILYGNAMAMENNITKAIHWYESAINSNDMSPIYPCNMRAWYNKGVVLFRNGNTTGAGHAFAIIFDEVERQSTVGPGTAFVLNAIGSIYFANKDYAGAFERFLLALTEDGLSPCQRAVTLCNIAIAHYKMGNQEESEEYFEQALQPSEFANESSKATLATIMCSFGYILWKRKLYLRAYNLFTEAASTENSKEESEFSIECRSYAEACLCKVLEQTDVESLTLPEPSTQEVTAKIPRFKASLVPIKDGHNAKRYIDPVFSPRRILSEALQVKCIDDDSFISVPTFSEDTKIIREYLQKQTEKGYRGQYALEFERLVVEHLNSRFEAIKNAML